MFYNDYWYNDNYWEPNVLLAIKDLCKPGDTVFDVGANMGGITQVMSRLVGPKGMVFAFECSPRIIEHTQKNIADQSLHNVTLFHKAVYSETGKYIDIYASEFLNDRIYKEFSTGEIIGKTMSVALDDIVDAYSVVPDFIKMDIEGAEFDAIKGATNLITQHCPHLVLEQQGCDLTCLDFLLDKGYKAIDLSNFTEYTISNKYDPSIGIMNILFIHESKIANTHYHDIQLQEIATYQSDFFKKNHLSGYTSSPFALKKGRYMLKLHMDAKGSNNNMFCGVRDHNKTHFRYHANSQMICHSYTEWSIDIEDTTNLEIFFDFLDNTKDDSFIINSVTIFLLPNMQLPKIVSILC